MRKVSIIMALCLALVFGLAMQTMADPTVPTINIFELQEGVPATVEFNNFSPLLPNPAIVTNIPEFVEISGVLAPDAFTALSIDGGLPSRWGAIMLEPVGGDGVPGSVSDFATLTFGAPVGTAPSILTIENAFNLQFVSDGAPNFDGLLAAFLAEIGDAPGQIHLVNSFFENGTLQNLFTFDGLVVNAASDVPIPPTVLLMGSGLLGLVGWRRLMKG